MKTNSSSVVLVRPRSRAFVLSLLLAAALAAAAAPHANGPAGAAAAPRAAAQDEVQLRSYAPPASGRLVVDPSERGGRARLTALGLPDPQTVSPYARTYVVWAVSGGRVVRVGELRRDRGGNGGLAFDRPAEFETYGVVVTAERSPEADKPGAPVLASRADAARTRFPLLAPPPTPAPPVTPSRPAASAIPARPAADAPPTRPAPPPRPAPRPFAAGGTDFYSEVDRALEASGGGRLIVLDGGTTAPGASARAHAALDEGLAYVRADFSNVPPPSAVGAVVYVLWAVMTDGRIVYMGSLPGTEELNGSEIYVRVGGFSSADFSLAVTAERRRPAPAPSAERVLR